jgi:hypothetical protein
MIGFDWIEMGKHNMKCFRHIIRKKKKFILLSLLSFFLINTIPRDEEKEE